MAKRAAKKQRRARRLSDLLREMAKSHPKAAAQLSAAQSNREQRLSRLLPGARLKGYEQLVNHLEALEPVFEKSRKLRPIAFLVGRARGDFHTALEATLSGFHSVAHDAMRDVMEIEFLLRDFCHEPQHIEHWVSCTDKERNDKFRPALLRQRHARRLGKEPQNLAEAADYRGHSMFLHVSPHRNPFGGPGLRDPQVPFADDSGFWEIFEHGRRVLFALHQLRRKVARGAKSPSGPERGLKKFRDAWQRTQEMQAIFIALLQAAGQRERADGAQQAAATAGRGPQPSE